jgi:hypothetical protein
MALLLVQTGIQPLGQFDAYTSLSTVYGGEVGVLQSAGADSNGYLKVQVRGATTGDTGPFYLIDDGTYGYGVMLGNTVTKTATGFSSGADTATRLGPATYAASGKYTLWDKPGLYAITSDACYDAAATLLTQTPGTKLTVDPTTHFLKVGNPASGSFCTVVGFQLNSSLVTTSGAVVGHKSLVVSFDGRTACTI